MNVKMQLSITVTTSQLSSADVCPKAVVLTNASTVACIPVKVMQ